MGRRGCVISWNPEEARRSHSEEDVRAKSGSRRLKRAAHVSEGSGTNTGAPARRRRQRQISGFTFNLSAVFAATGSFFSW